MASKYRVEAIARCAVRLALACGAVAIAGCASTRNYVPDVVSPYKIDVQQGNVVTRDQVSQLKAGMTRDQVKFVLGSSLLTDMFHGDRWDYLYRFQVAGTATETRRLTLLFSDNKLVSWSGDDMPAELPFAKKESTRTVVDIVGTAPAPVPVTSPAAPAPAPAQAATPIEPPAPIPLPRAPDRPAPPSATFASASASASAPTKPAVVPPVAATPPPVATTTATTTPTAPGPAPAPASAAPGATGLRLPGATRPPAPAIAAVTPIPPPPPATPVAVPTPPGPAAIRVDRAGLDANTEAEAIKSMLEAWRLAWSTKSIETYLGFYTNKYKPANMTRESWMEQRRSRLGRPATIQVEVNDVRIQMTGPLKARVTFYQSYASDVMRETGVKVLFLVKEAGAWKIEWEQFTPR